MNVRSIRTIQSRRNKRAALKLMRKLHSAAAREHAGISLLRANGAGANQTSSFMVHFATALVARGIDTVTFNFVYSASEEPSGAGHDRSAQSIGSKLQRNNCAM
jgi:predicted alpha/beta-hydrolase family hydrolase